VVREMGFEPTNS